MVVSALGLPILLQATNTQLDGLFAGLSVGDQLRGRVVEVLPQDKAVVNLRGQNVVAQLPAGSQVQKGDGLLLQVTQSQAALAGKGGSLTLRLLTDPAAALGPSGAASAAAAATPLPAQAVLEQAIGNARLPVSNLTLTVAQTLARLGAPLDAAGLQRAVQSTEALLANEAPAAAGVGAARLSPQAQLGLQDALGQLRLAAQFSPSGQDRLLLQQAVRDITQALLEGPVPASSSSPALETGPASSAAPNPALAPTGAPVPVAPSPSFPLTGPQGPSLPGAPAPTASMRPQAGMVMVEQAVSQLLQQPSNAGVQALALALVQLQAGPMPAGPSSGVAPAPMTAASLAVSAGPANVTPAALHGAFLESLPSLPARREAMVQLLAVAAPPAEPQGPLVTSQVLAQAQALSESYANPDSGAARALVAAVQAQQPQAAPAQILADARQALSLAVQALQAPGTPAELSGPPALNGLLQDAGQAMPKLNLSQLPPEHVAEAVAWLQARDLPAQRPLVEAVASWINQDQTALPATQKAIAQTQSLPSALLDARPSLGQALQQVEGALQQSSLRPDAQGLDQQLGQWSRTQGVDFESRLGSAEPSLEAAPAHPMAPSLKAAQEAVNALKPALLRLEVELKATLKAPEAQAAPVARHLESALQQTQAAVQALNAVPLQAQPAPAFDSVHMPLPVLMNGPLGDGKLSVTWRHGRERRLDDTEPVNVAVALNTDSLGPVKVLLQVWKGSANVRVIGADPSAAQYLSGGADDLRSGFAERTPFKLQTLEFAAAEGGPQGAPSGPEAPGPASAAGLNLSA